MIESGSMLTKPVPGPERGRKLKEPSASDNFRMRAFCFKTKIWQFKSGWISSENMFVAPTRKGETLPKLANLLKNELLLFSMKENLSPEEFACHVEQRFETALQCFCKN